MDPKNQQQFNPQTPISEVLKQEQSGFTPSAPKLNDVVDAISNMYVSTKKDPASTAGIPPKTNGVSPSAESPRIIKTYRSDAAEAVKVQQESVVKIAIAEDKQRIERGEKEEDSPKKRVSLLVMALVLIIIGAAAIPASIYIINRKKQAVAINSEKTIIPFDRQKDIVIDKATRNDLVSELGSLGAREGSDSTIEYMKIFENTQDTNNKTVTQKIAPEVFASLIGPNIPSALARSFDSDYMFGSEDANKTFILFKTSSYQQTSAGMFRWETKMPTDLSPILNLSRDAIGRPFSDQVIANKDVRAITQPDGTIIFLYGFLDNQTLIITTSAQAFQDINSRYIAAQFVQ